MYGCLCCRYNDAVATLNRQLQARVQGNSDRVLWTHCDYDSMFLSGDRQHLREDRLPDGVHPNAEAWELLATCLDSVIAVID